MTDIVKRLRGPAPYMIGPWMDEAADEIEKLRADLAEARAEAIRLRGYNEGLTKINADLEANS